MNDLRDLDPIDWQDRLHRAVAETLRRRAARRQLRADLEERRRRGLAARHTAKLARSSTAPSTAEEPMTDPHRVILDLTGLDRGERQALAYALTRAAGMPSLRVGAAVALGRAARAIQASAATLVDVRPDQTRRATR